MAFLDKRNLITKDFLEYNLAIFFLFDSPYISFLCVWFLLTLDEAGADHSPGEQEAEGDVPLDLPDVPDLCQGEHLGHHSFVVKGLWDGHHQRIVNPEHHLPEVLGAGKLALLPIDGVTDVAAVGVTTLPASVQVSGNVLAVTPGEMRSVITRQNILSSDCIGLGKNH